VPAWVPALVFVACFGGGAWASSRWLPELADGAVGTISFFAVCGLFAAGLGLAGMHVYTFILDLKIAHKEFLHSGSGVGDVVAANVTNLLFEAGVMFGLAAVVYLLAPAPEGEALA
jgi:hypothetical protein